MKISLCMICGNEEAIILRCLESAKTAFDELCLVSAVGNRAADKTLYKSEKWCAENGKMFHGEHYRNTRDLPHVDDFGAARNLSFSLATGVWQMWLDCDDYLDEINCARIREAVSVCTPETNAIFATYKVEKQGAAILRERLIRLGNGRWKSPIHETCEISGMAVECPQIVVYHSDHKPKNESSALRNAAILQYSLEDAPRHFFYLHADLKLLGRKEEAIQAALAALYTLPERSIEERYLVLLNLSELQPDKREDHLHAAARLQPHRREAFAYLCQSALIAGRASDAVSFFRIMDALPMPNPMPWTHQGIWYGWARNALRVSCLRACGQNEEADRSEVEYAQDPDYRAGMKKEDNGT